MDGFKMQHIDSDIDKVAVKWALLESEECNNLYDLSGTTIRMVKTIRNGFGELYKIFKEQDVVGYMELCKACINDDSNRNHVYSNVIIIRRIYISSKYRRTGAGRYAVLKVKHHYKNILACSNIESISFWKSVGFEEVKPNKLGNNIEMKHGIVCVDLHPPMLDISSEDIFDMLKKFANH